MRRLVIVVTLVGIAAGCGGPDEGADAGGFDASRSGEDAGAVDAHTGCARLSDCDDERFCNGLETCVDAICLEGEPPCDAETQRCIEAERRCVPSACEGTSDADGDGHISVACGGDDCDDEDPGRYPGNAEACDPEGRDEDCDPSTYGFRDADMDGWPDARCCNGDECGDDCDDTLPSAHPSEAESCDGLDNDCDGMVDEGVTQIFHVDADGDGHGDPAGETVQACFAPERYAERPDDCDDSRGSVHPRAAERCDRNSPPLDEDCDGVANPEELCNCTGTEAGSCLEPGVCQMGTRTCLDGMWSECSIAPTAELCDGEDDDCDGSIDEALLVRCFSDADGDTFPEVGAALSELCPDDARAFVGGCPSGYTYREPIGAANLDCDDADAGRHPMAAEVCDAVDQDCDGAIDEGRRVTCWPDGDGDGYAASGASGADLCPPPGMTTCPMGQTNREPLAGAVDCADDDAARTPSAIEACNGVDDDCDGRTDEGLRVSCWTDADSDGYAASGSVAMSSCPDPGTGGCPAQATEADPATGAVDCDDTTAARSPAVVEACNGIDDDCDTAVDEGVRVNCYTDGDEDGFAPAGAAAMSVCPEEGAACPVGTTSRGPGAGSNDCDDTNAGVSPAVVETACDGVDEDCDGMVDEGLRVPLYPDADGDQHGAVGSLPEMLCAGTEGYSAAADDCLDDEPRVHPEAEWSVTPLCLEGGEPCTFEDFDGSTIHACCDDGGNYLNEMVYWDFDCSAEVEPEHPPGGCTGACGSCAVHHGMTYDDPPRGNEEPDPFDPTHCGRSFTYVTSCAFCIGDEACRGQGASEVLGCR